MLGAGFYFLVCILKYLEFVVPKINKIEMHPNIHIAISIVEFFPFNQKLTTNRMIKIIVEIIAITCTSLDFFISVLCIL
jgi:hypothetical protein